MAKVHQNLSWAVAYNVVAIPIAAGLLLPQFDFAMTPSLSGESLFSFYSYNSMWLKTNKWFVGALSLCYSITLFPASEKWQTFGPLINN